MKSSYVIIISRIEPILSRIRGKCIRPKREKDQPQRELFQVDLEQLIGMNHPLVRLGLCTDWASFEQALGATYHPTQGAPGISTRLMVALHYLKYQHDLSGENVVAAWVENPYWQHFSGERYFQRRVPIEPSSMTRWRQRMAGRREELYGQPYDSHTLAAQLKQVNNLIGDKVSEAYVDIGYRGHDYDGAVTVRVDKRQRGRTPRPLWRWMKRRAAVEPSIGHLKTEHRLERNRLKGVAATRSMPFRVPRR